MIPIIFHVNFLLYNKTYKPFSIYNLWHDYIQLLPKINSQIVLFQILPDLFEWLFLVIFYRWKIIEIYWLYTIRKKSMNQYIFWTKNLFSANIINRYIFFTRLFVSFLDVFYFVLPYNVQHHYICNLYIVMPLLSIFKSLIINSSSLFDYCDRHLYWWIMQKTLIYSSLILYWQTLK